MKVLNVGDKLPDFSEDIPKIKGRFRSKFEVRVREFFRGIKDKYFNWNLLDGQKRFEIVARRLYVVLSLFAILMLVATILGNKKNVETKVVVEQCRESVLKTGDVLNGSKITIDDNGKVWYSVPAPKEEKKEEVKKAEVKPNTKTSNVKVADPKKIAQVYQAKGSPRTKDVEWIYKEAQKRKINPSLFLAVQGIESSYGKNCYKNNCWGFGKWGDGTVIAKYFTGKDYKEGTLIVLDGWVENGYANLHTAEDMQKKGYNSSAHWLNSVKLIQSYWD